MAAINIQPQTGGKNTPVAAIAKGFVVVHCPSLHCCQLIHAPETNWTSAASQNMPAGIFVQTKRSTISGSASVGRSQRTAVATECPLPPHAKANSPQKLKGSDNTKAITRSLEMLAFLSRTFTTFRISGNDTSEIPTRIDDAYLCAQTMCTKNGAVSTGRCNTI
jgi:hypothetical protein